MGGGAHASYDSVYEATLREGDTACPDDPLENMTMAYVCCVLLRRAAARSPVWTMADRLWP